MYRQKLKNLLQSYTPTDPSEQQAKRDMLLFLEDHPDCFHRSCLSGHFTGSCWLVNHDNTHCALMLHRKLNMWLQFGGHCDGDHDVLAVALKEAREESGIDNIMPLSPQIFDVDIHALPQIGDVPAHIHLDVRFLLQAVDDVPLVQNNESYDLRWFPMDIKALPTSEPSIIRMFHKWITSQQHEESLQLRKTSHTIV